MGTRDLYSQVLFEKVLTCPWGWGVGLEPLQCGTSRTSLNSSKGTPFLVVRQTDRTVFIAGSLEAAYSLNWGAREIWGKGGGETLALL